MSPGRPPATHRRTSESIRETLENVAIAFVLAFVFRAFVVEAFVIPTGSMAPNLYGAHTTYTCSDCGYAFAVAHRGEGIEPVCPNCGYRGRELVRPQTGAVDPGDRILVLKWPFDVGGRFGPRRWDVTVFKNPADGRQNYIKRLVGLPGEVLELIDGDLYVVPAEQVPREVLDSLVNLPGKRALTPPTRQLLHERMRLVAKTPAAQAALWHLVFDQDYLPARRRPNGASAAPGWTPVEPGNGWDDCLTRVIRFDGAERQEFGELAFGGKRIADFYGYNGQTSEPAMVSDNRLGLVLEPQQAEGRFRLQLCKRSSLIWATLDGEGQAWLTRRARAGGEEEELARGDIRPWQPGRLIEVEFCVIDGHAMLRVDGAEVFGQPVPIAPLVASDVLDELAKGPEAPPDVRLAAAGTRLAVRHVLLERDVYYRSDARLSRGNPQIGWGTTGNPIYLRPRHGRDQPGDYFMLGDNSPQSKDSRLWPRREVGPHLGLLRDNYQVGTVPGDQLIGRAFFVYWPAGIRPLGGSVPVLGRLPLIPNVGRMRFIH